MHPSTRVIVRSLFLLLLFLLAAVLSSRPFYGSPSPVVNGPVLLSDSAVLTPEEAVQQAAVLFQKNERPPLDMTTHRYWWVAEVANPTADPRWVVHLGNTAVEHGELFLFDGTKQIHHDAVDLLAEARRDLPRYTIGHHFPIDLPTGSHRIVALRIETPVAHQGLVFLKPAPIAAAEARFYQVAIWAAAGAVAALICYNIFLGISLRLSPYFFYVGHAGGHLLYLLTALGILGAAEPIVQRYLLFNIPGIAIGVGCGAVFVYTFLDLPQFAPRLARAYQVFVAALVSSPALALFFSLHTFLTVIRASHLVLAALVIAAALVGIIHGRRDARYILVGWCGMLAMTAKGMLGVMGVVDLSIDAGIWALWAVLFEMFFLSLALADRVRRLHREKQAAQAANVAKSAFLANMSHEIRTPLNGVLGMVDVLRGTRLDAKQQEYLENIRQCGNVLLTVLNDILDYSRVEAGRVKLESTDFSLRALLEELRFLVAIQANQKKLRLQLTIDPRVPPMLVGDPARLRQVLLNLVGNAIKFTHQGEVTLTVEWVEQRAGGNRLRFTVTDTGIGMDAEALNHLFDRFYQAENSIARRYGGTGLGLAITKELVALMGGEVRVESELGRGSRFVVELTLATGTRPATANAVTAEIPPLPHLSILVVDDDAINRLVAMELLSRDGHHVAAADSGAAAIARTAEQRFDLVLMDLGMPEMDGVEATRRLRARGVQIPIIGLTAHVLPEHTAACMEAGMEAVIHKPIQADDLKRILASVLHDSHAPAAAAV